MSALTTSTAQRLEQARDRSKTIRQNLTEAVLGVRLALELEDWRVMGYASPAAWAEGEFGEVLALIVPGLEQGTRKALAVAFRQDGHSTRAAGEKLGMSASAVSSATKGVELPEKTRSKDGRERPSRRLALVPALPDVVDAEVVGDVVETVVRAQHLVVADLVAASERGGMTVKDVLAVMASEGWHHGHASGALSRAKRQGLIVASETRRDGCVAWVTPAWL